MRRKLSNNISDEDKEIHVKKTQQTFSIKEIIDKEKMEGPVQKKLSDLRDKSGHKKFPIDPWPENEKESKLISNNNNDFYTQYKDPRWQKKRLEIMNRDNFICTSCNDSGSTLNVHHKVPYRKDTKIWEYNNDELTTLCEGCHKYISNVVKECNSAILGTCYSIDSATEVFRIIDRIDRMNPWQLQSVWKLIDILIKF